MADDASSHDQPPTTAAEAVAGSADVPMEIATPTALTDDIAGAAEGLEAVTVPTTGTATPFEMDPEQRSNSLKVSLADICARATALYAHKSYEEAAEVFAQAAEMQAEMNGEMSPENAEILFLYGRALFRVGQAKSDVLGGKAPDAKKPAKKEGKSTSKKANGNTSVEEGPAADDGGAPPSAEQAQGQSSEADRVAEEAVAIVAGAASGAKEADDKPETKKPLFQFTGDENFDDSDEEEEAGGEGEGEAGEAEEEEDDLAVAFEILDLARVLFNKRLEAVGVAEAETEGKGKEKAEEGDSLTVQHIKERLADTHDLLAEISLENERYPNAMTDFRESLKFKMELYPEESEVIAEAHYKLSLALEFASVTTSEEESKASGPKPVDQNLRDEAAAELEAAIKSTTLKLHLKEVELATLHSPEDNDNTRKQIAEVKDIIADMKQRLLDLRKPPIDVNTALFGQPGPGGNPMGGVLGAALGESPAQTEARLEDAKKNAKDLTGLVRKKNKEEPAKPVADADADAKTNGHEANGSGKRKAEELTGEDEESKKARVEDAVEA